MRYMTARGKSSVVLRHDSTGWVNVFVSFYDGDPVETGDKIESRDNNLTMEDKCFS